MRDGTPQSLWDRVMRALDGWMGAPDGEGGVDEGILAFHLVFIVPLLLAFVMLLRR
ncbi:MAG: hypothetical protein ACXWG1_18945 [Usitatibacter sp.]